jgi:glycosyltransferase involved in cell wall biosynthesis
MTLVETKLEPEISASHVSASNVSTSTAMASHPSPSNASPSNMSSRNPASLIPISVIVPVRNEAANLSRCLAALADFAEVYVIDSQSTDDTSAIAQSYGAKVVQFHYSGGWPKKRQWAMNTIPFACEWILLLDADEVLTPGLVAEIRAAIQNPAVDGYFIRLEMYFLRRVLRHCDAGFWKLSLFRAGRGHYECRLKDQDASMADIEIHEHVVVDGHTRELANPLVHHNVDSLSRYIAKHNEYSNWEARVLLQPAGDSQELKADLFGTQAQRRRWLKGKLYRLPGSPVLLFFYRYLFRLGILDGVPGLIYCLFQAVQMFHTKSKIYELRRGRN